MPVTGKDLIALGFQQGADLGHALKTVNQLGLDGDALAHWVADNKPAAKIKLQTAPDYAFNIEAETEAEVENVTKVRQTMDILMRTPTIRGGAVMPDACPSGPDGTIPVGGVVVAQNAIHPGMHSADICCSVMVTEFADSDPANVLNAVHKATHFGPGGRTNGQRYTLNPELYDAFRGNSFLNTDKILRSTHVQLGTQGDGNHFAYVGTSRAKGTTCLVTHHGSRGPGAGLYKQGMVAAERWRTKLSDGVLKQNAWIPADSDEGRAYWDALQLIRAWTKDNHDVIHRATAALAEAEVQERFWNEHNFVFRKGDLFYHAKGATPVDTDLLPDTNGTQIVPLNMAEPVLLIRGKVNGNNLGFAPHGAGRNFSRTAHKRAMAGRTQAEIFTEETAGIDARFFSGNIDVSELPSAYKPAATVRAQMAKYGLADVVDEIVPHGCIMAGDWEKDAPWRKKAAAKWAAKQAKSP
ncbi:RtcB family protein [Actibacterium sp. 188UL27-1]|uniref:RtcB family protein n=1 Tax=Actibacterium sp. 188UL27-1 TaxID=2786961 RepID=UPI00195998C9|nr:RtcB family protein [Actibacterium sp. 188UL27-1]MBM7067614.1 RtcB family protein [Actibacterium sp. 188UL27-1]